MWNFYWKSVINEISIKSNKSNGIIAVGIYGGSLNNFLINFIPYWLQKVVLNFPFALLSQLFFIQPLTRTIFRAIFKNKLANENNSQVDSSKKKLAEMK